MSKPGLFTKPHITNFSMSWGAGGGGGGRGETFPNRIQLKLAALPELASNFHTGVRIPFRRPAERLIIALSPAT